MLETISHIALVVKDPPRTAALFHDLFGARVVTREDEEGHLETFIRLAGTWIALVGALVQRSRTGEHIAFRATPEFLEATVAKLHAMGRDFIRARSKQIREVNGIGTFSFRGFRFQDTVTVQGRALVARARQVAMSRVTAAENHGAPSGLRNLFSGDVALFSLRLGGKLYVASATNGPSLIRCVVPPGKGYFASVGSDRNNGSLLVVYQAPHADSHHLVPLAVLTMRSRTSGIKVIEAGDGYGPW